MWKVMNVQRRVAAAHRAANIHRPRTSNKIGGARRSQNQPKFTTLLPIADRKLSISPVCFLFLTRTFEVDRFGLLAQNVEVVEKSMPHTRKLIHLLFLFFS